MRLPPDPEGYTVEGQTVHSRYASHANGYRSRTVKGVENLLDGKKPRICKDCFPAGTPPSADNEGPQVRRVAKPADNGDGK